MRKFNYRKAMVTGGAGFIGSHIVKRLLDMGVEVISIDNYAAGKKENLSGYDKEKLLEVNCDILDYQKLKEYFEDIEVVFHNAASKKTVCLNDPRLDLDVNAKGVFNLLELSRDFGVKKFVHASTGSVYGEAQYFPQNEEHPLNPASYYGVSKLAGERYVLAFAHLYGMNTTILRYFHVYGPKQDSSEVGGVVAIFLRRALSGLPLVIHGDGTQMRSFTYVDDLVDANFLVASDDTTRSQVFNCASGIKVTIQELAEKVIECTERQNIKIEYDDWTPGDIKVFDIDNSKLRSIGFSFKTSFSDGLRKTCEWYEKNPR